MCSIPLPSVTARHELTIRAASACITTVGRSPPGRLSRAFQQASQFSTVWVSSSLKRFTAMARCSREPITRFIHRGGKGVVKRTDRTGLRRSLMSALIKPHGTKPYLRHIEAEICPPDEAGALSANDQGYPDRLDLSYTNGGNRRPGPATSVQKRSRRRSTEIAAWSSSELRATSDSRSIRR